MVGRGLISVRDVKGWKKTTWDGMSGIQLIEGIKAAQKLEYNDTVNKKEFK